MVEVNKAKTTEILTIWVFPSREMQNCGEKWLYKKGWLASFRAPATPVAFDFSNHLTP